MRNRKTDTQGLVLIESLAAGVPVVAMGLYSEAGDYWSLGIVLLEALTGRHGMGSICANRFTGSPRGRWRLGKS
jgi:hypothetical protein